MAAKPMPRIRAGISGSPVITAPKRPMPIPAKSKDTSQQSPIKNVQPSVIKDAQANTITSKHGLEVANSVSQSTVTDNTTLEDDGLAVEQLDNSSKSLLLNETTSGAGGYQQDLASLDKPRTSLNNISNHTENTDRDAEIDRLKQLMMLQVSLISRQQDLLKLRDKEIMQLKTTKQSYKSRLERMERRISLSRRHSDNNNFRFQTSKPDSHRSSVGMATEDKFLPEFDLFEDDGAQPSSNSRTERRAQSTPKSTEPDKLKNQTGRSTSLGHESVTNVPITSPVSMVTSAFTARGCIPVPMSFIERCQNQLSMTPPSGKNNQIFTQGLDANQPISLKVCDHCSQCVAMATEIKSSLPLETTIDRCDVSESDRTTIIPSVSDGTQVIAEDDENLEMETDQVLQTKHPYYREILLRDENLYKITDYDSFPDDGSALNIPTWKVNELKPLSQLHGKDMREHIDDDTYSKRHSRLETAEKRRKRWDIQRIREYRYNEKLRQKLLKQERENEILDTFAPSLNNIIAIEVQETLPINVFGHSLLALRPEEFSLPSSL